MYGHKLHLIKMFHVFVGLIFALLWSCQNNISNQCESVTKPDQKKQIMGQIKLVETILYVNDQEESCKFYQKIFRKLPDLNVQGMTEFIISDNCKIGLMPNKSIVKILAGKTLNPNSGNGIPRCELYFYVENIQMEFDNAIKSGAKLISPIQNRDWGDKVCYFADPNGHIIAFAEKIGNGKK